MTVSNTTMEEFKTKVQQSAVCYIIYCWSISYALGLVSSSVSHNFSSIFVDLNILTLLYSYVIINFSPLAVHHSLSTSFLLS